MVMLTGDPFTFVESLEETLTDAMMHTEASTLPRLDLPC